MIAPAVVDGHIDISLQGIFTLISCWKKSSKTLRPKETHSGGHHAEFCAATNAVLVLPEEFVGQIHAAEPAVDKATLRQRSHPHELAQA